MTLIDIEKLNKDCLYTITGGKGYTIPLGIYECNEDGAVIGLKTAVEPFNTCKNCFYCMEDENDEGYIFHVCTYHFDEDGYHFFTSLDDFCSDWEPRY